jgi:hypothetical protein
MTWAVTHARESTSSPMLAHLGFDTIDAYECLYLSANRHAVRDPSLTTPYVE